MQGVIEFLQGWQLHPTVDHFTVALIIVGILIDLFAALLPSRYWLRATATTLMVLGAAAAAGSNLTGGWEAHRVWPYLTEPAKELLKKHAWWGDILPWVYVGLAVWRLGIQFIGFVARTRMVYLIVAIIGGGLIIYQGSLGGDLVYDYGVGTALLNKPAPLPAAPATQSEPSGPIPTVFVPPPTPAAVPTPEAPASPAPVPTIVVPSAAMSPAGSSGTEINPPPGAAAPPSAAASPEAKSTTL
jgi:uncharacterized membrane protein